MFNELTPQHMMILNHLNISDSTLAELYDKFGKDVADIGLQMRNLRNGHFVETNTSAGKTLWKIGSRGTEALMRIKTARKIMEERPVSKPKEDTLMGGPSNPEPLVKPEKEVREEKPESPVRITKPEKTEKEKVEKKPMKKNKSLVLQPKKVQPEVSVISAMNYVMICESETEATPDGQTINIPNRCLPELIEWLSQRMRDLEQGRHE